MKKKMFFISLLFVMFIAGLFVLTGCGKNTNDNENSSSENSSEKTKDNTIVTIDDETFKLNSDKDFNNIHYKENYVDFNTDQIGNMRTMSYVKDGNLAFEVRVMYDENRSDSELKAMIETQFKVAEKSKEVNGIRYIYYEYVMDTGEQVHHYIYVYNGKVYSIGFFLGDNPGDIEEVFMNNVRFE